MGGVWGSYAGRERRRHPEVGEVYPWRRRASSSQRRTLSPCWQRYVQSTSLLVKSVFKSYNNSSITAFLCLRPHYRGFCLMFWKEHLSSVRIVCSERHRRYPKTVPPRSDVQALGASSINVRTQLHTEHSSFVVF